MNLRTGAGLAALLTLPGIGMVRAHALATHFATWAQVIDAHPADLRRLIGPAADAITAHAQSHPDLHAPRLPAGTRALAIFDPEYPASLRSIDSPPPLLWVTGTLPADSDPLLAIVGTRHPTRYGAAVATQAAAEATHAGIGVISGLAHGIDSLAHSAALDAHGPTWAVLGQGVDTVPEGTARRDLADRILATGGGLISEVAPGVPAAPHLLARRNRLQSGLAWATLIAQSGMPGPSRPAGTLHTARYALTQSRLLLVARPRGCWATEPESAGNLALTDPQGCPPAALHLRSGDTHPRPGRPAADLVLTSAADLREALDQARRAAPGAGPDTDAPEHPAATPTRGAEPALF